MSDILRPDVVRKTVHYWANRQTPDDIERSRGAVIGHLQDACKQDLYQGGVKVSVTDENRRLVLGWLLTPENVPLKPVSMKQVTSAQLWGLHRWIGARKEETVNKWVPRSTFRAEAAWVLAWARFDHERGMMDTSLVMGDFLKFWLEHGFDLNDEPELAHEILYLGGAAHT